MSLSRGLLAPRLRLLVVHGNALALDVHPAEVALALCAPPLGTDRVRRHRLRVVGRHAVAVVEDAAHRGCGEEVALRKGVVG